MPDKNYSRTVYTTETGRVCPNCGQPVDDCCCKKQSARPLGDGVVRVMLDRKGRKGGSVSVISGLPGSDDDLRALASDLKRRFGTGGTLKDGVIEIQGDHRDAIIEALKAKGIRAKKAGG